MKLHRNIAFQAALLPVLIAGAHAQTATTPNSTTTTTTTQNATPQPAPASPIAQTPLTSAQGMTKANSEKQQAA